MKLSLLLGTVLLGGSLLADDAVSAVAPSSETVQTPPAPAVQEIILANKEPLTVTVTNFPPKEVQDVKLNPSDTINVVVSNPVKTVEVEKEKPLLNILNGATNLLTVENSALLGEMETDLQNLWIHKVVVNNKNGEHRGIKIRSVADDKLEVSKDFKILVENEIYMDEEEVKKLQNALAKMIASAEKPVENKDFKLSFRTTGDFELSLYTTSQLFGNTRGVEGTILIGKTQKYPSKAILTLKELAEFKAILDKYESTKISPL